MTRPRTASVNALAEVAYLQITIHVFGSNFGMGVTWAQRVDKVYRVATTSLEFMSMVMVHPEVPRNSNGAGLGPRL
jgi:hypothetical protein